MEREIVLVAIGKVETQVLTYLCAALTETFECSIL